MLTLSIQDPNWVWVPCIAIDPGPKKVEADAYKIAIALLPNINSLFFEFPKASLASTKNIYSPVNINPRFPSVFDGSRRKPPLTRSHHLEISPIACSFDAGGPHPF